MRDAPERVAQALAHLPDQPGVYLWKDAEGTILYVGKAKRLRPRSASKRSALANSDPSARSPS